GGPVAALATHPVRGLEADAAWPGRGGVAAEAHRRGRGITDPEPPTDLLRAVVAQHRPGAAVRAGGGGRVLPEAQFVLTDDRAVRLAAAVAGGAAAGGDA